MLAQLLTLTIILIQQLHQPSIRKGEKKTNKLCALNFYN
ncbi:hypothetical protein GLYMA_01G079550v4 [Glycine max]|nr:hypothetical protein GLYMA_01G079550v4 [Glycine max]KAH1162145.1 hypothetical protein GYH30_000855 [Glycine max]